LSGASVKQNSEGGAGGGIAASHVAPTVSGSLLLLQPALEIAMAANKIVDLIVLVILKA
jgi:hypothetical protein